MLYGRMGANLEIDLSQGKIEIREGEHRLYETYLGGKGIAAKLFWDRVPPEVTPFSPDNLLIFANGVLTGTPAPSANKVTISFKSPLTNLFSISTIGGFWATELKHAGYDTMVISGKSPTPVYLWINNKNVEIRDASHLWGKDTTETQRILQEELKNDKAQILCIGPAGENKVYAAAIEHGIGSGNSASRAGPGAIMGDKNIKAIAVYGTKDVYIAKPPQFIELCEYILERAEPLRNYFRFKHASGETVQGFAAWGSFGNAETMPSGLGFEDIGKIYMDFANKFRVREPACYNCPFRCTQTISLPGVGYVPLKCQAWYGFIFACKLLDFTFGVKCHDLCIRYGLDFMSTSQSIAFAIDLYEKGILTKQDTEGMHLEWGNAELAFSLIGKIARREGIGDILANGVYQAAHLIGRGAEKYAHHVKKLELMLDTLRHPYYSVVTATSERADGHTSGTGSLYPSSWYGMERDEYIKGGWWLFPDEFEKYVDVNYEVEYEGLAEVTAYAENIKTLADLTGLCWFYLGFYPFNPIKLNTIVKLISAATGMDIDETKAMKIADRTRTLIRANNVRLGIRRKDDALPEKFFQESPSDYQKQAGLMKLDHDKVDKELDEYYQLRGWNSEGIPSKQRLEELGLDDVRQDLEGRGILTNEDSKNNKN